jgi:hypothetical protein
MYIILDGAIDFQINIKDETFQAKYIVDIAKDLGINARESIKKFTEFKNNHNHNLKH